MSRGAIVAWRKFRKMSPPVENFRNGRTSAATYSEELSLDHLASSLVDLFEKWNAEGTNRRRRAMVAATELDEIIERLGRESDDRQGRLIVEYAWAMREVLSQLLLTPSESERGQDRT
jgi:hypothetical protein